MATQPETTEVTETEIELSDELEEAVEIEREVTLAEVLEASNIVPLLDKQDVRRIGHQALEEYETDLGTCTDYHARLDRAMDVAMQVKKAKTFPWPNASNVCYPLLTQAAVQFQARAYPAIVDGGRVVKARVLGPDEDGSKADRAERISQHMSWQFLNDVPGWEEDTDKLLLQLPILGCLFRKTWHDPVDSRNKSETVSAKDFITNYDACSLERLPRFTHRQRYYPHEIEAFVRAGEWAEVNYDGEDGSDPHSIVEILEQHRLIDMDGDGLPEPYVVTMTTEGEVARIAACFDADTIFVKSPMFAGQKPMSDLIEANIPPIDIKIVRIARTEYFTKYGFIPAPDGSFYDIGFGTLTDDIASACNTIINQLIDAGTLANMQGGFIAGGTKIKGGNMRFTPGEWKRVEGATSGPLRDNILPLQLPGPNATLFQLLGMLVDAVQQITSVSDIMTGNQETQTAPTTALALIEEGQKVFSAIYQRIHRSLGRDIKIMRRLNRDYLDEEQYFALNDDQQAVGRADYETDDLDVTPVSDPRAINDRVKMAKAQVVQSFTGDPLIDQMEIRKRVLEAAGIEGVADLVAEEPPENPELLQKQAEMSNERDKSLAEIRSKDADTAAKLVEAAKVAFELGGSMQDDAMRAFALEMLGDAQALASAVFQQTQEAVNGSQTGEPGGVPGMGGEPADAGIPAVPQGPGADAGAPMGAGPVNV